jgi:hypothetical protein
MQNYSSTIAAIIIGLLGVFGIGGLVTSEEVGQGIDLVLNLGALIYLWYKRYKQGDVTALGFRK